MEDNKQDINIPSLINKGEIILYQPNANIRLEVRFEDETVWLTQQQIADLFGTKRPAITKHLSNIFKSGELDEQSTCSILEHMGNDGKQQYQTRYYNLDAILSVGYRVNSVNATAFRRWATSVLKNYLIQGYSVNRHLVAIQQQIDNRFNQLEIKVEEHQQQLDLIIKSSEKPTEYLIPTGCEWDGYSYLSELIKNATKEIVLIDNYVDETTLLLLDKRQSEVSCTVHTRYSEKINLDFEKHNKQYRAIKKIQLPQAVHDRFLIIDNEVWHLGTSVKDMGHSLCSIIKMGIAPAQVLNLISPT